MPLACELFMSHIHHCTSQSLGVEMRVFFVMLHDPLEFCVHSWCTERMPTPRRFFLSVPTCSKYWCHRNSAVWVMVCAFYIIPQCAPILFLRVAHTLRCTLSISQSVSQSVSVWCVIYLLLESCGCAGQNHGNSSCLWYSTHVCLCVLAPHPLQSLPYPLSHHQQISHLCALVSKVGIHYTGIRYRVRG